MKAEGHGLDLCVPRFALEDRCRIHCQDTFADQNYIDWVILHLLNGTITSLIRMQSMTKSLFLFILCELKRISEINYTRMDLKNSPTFLIKIQLQVPMTLGFVQ